MILPILISVVSASEVWEDSPALSQLWESIHGNEQKRMELLIASDPTIARSRSTDGRGGAWWAWEYRNADALAILSVAGVDILELGKDAKGLLPKDLCKEPECDLNEIKRKVTENLESAKKRLAEAKKLIEEEADFDDVDEEEITPGKMNEIIPEEGLSDDDDEL